MSSMSKGEGSMVGLDGGVMRAVSRFGFGILTHCTAAALHHAPRTRLPACLAKHRPLNATCSLLSWNPAGDFHALG